jgi:hypothetical protein
MKKHLAIVLFFLFSVQLNGQSARELFFQEVLETRSTNELDLTEGKYRFIEKHSDSLNFGLLQSNYRLLKKNTNLHIGLLLLSQGSAIIYSEIYSWGLNEESTGFEQKKIDSWAKDELLMFDVQHLARLPDRSTFGVDCMNRLVERDLKVMLNMVEEQQVDELAHWLKSINPVFQAFGYLGFKLLQEKGYEVDTNVVVTMNELQSSSRRVYRCSGCTFQGPTPFLEILSQDNIEAFVKRFSDQR